VRFRLGNVLFFEQLGDSHSPCHPISRSFLREHACTVLYSRKEDEVSLSVNRCALPIDEAKQCCVYE